MTTLTAQPPPTLDPAPVGARRRVRLVLDPAAAPDVTVRVLGLLRRRGCQIAAVDYRSSDRHRPSSFEVAFDAPARTGHRVETWLSNLVDVLEVRVL